ncbi:MAG: hypothetical protein K6F51_15695 [Acetatifactor sp.]|nr:hypothetical protein [Acetatifactor sp.]
MKNYVKPVIIANDEIAESVYMASGDGSNWSSDCWTINYTDVQKWAGDSHVFELRADHSTDYEHISGCTVVTVTFSAPLSENGSRAEFPYVINGNTMTITRELLGDSYKSGDNYTFKVWAFTGDQATTEAITITNLTISCRHDVNVQGRID